MTQAMAKNLVEKIKSDSTFREKVFSIKDKNKRMRFIAECGYSYIEDEIVQLRDNCVSYVKYSKINSAGCECYDKKCFGPWCPSRCDEDGGNYGEGCGM